MPKFNFGMKKPPQLRGRVGGKSDQTVGIATQLPSTCHAISNSNACCLAYAMASPNGRVVGHMGMPFQIGAALPFRDIMRCFLGIVCMSLNTCSCVSLGSSEDNAIQLRWMLFRWMSLCVVFMLACPLVGWLVGWLFRFSVRQRRT